MRDAEQPGNRESFLGWVVTAAGLLLAALLLIAFGVRPAGASPNHNTVVNVEVLCNGAPQTVTVDLAPIVEQLRTIVREEAVCAPALTCPPPIERVDSHGVIRFGWKKHGQCRVMGDRCAVPEEEAPR